MRIIIPDFTRLESKNKNVSQKKVRPQNGGKVSSYSLYKKMAGKHYLPLQENDGKLSPLQKMAGNKALILSPLTTSGGTAWRHFRFLTTTVRTPTSGSGHACGIGRSNMAASSLLPVTSLLVPGHVISRHACAVRASSTSKS